MDSADLIRAYSYLERSVKSMKDNTTHRHGEHGLIPPRQNRFFKMGEDWFFAIRRGVDQGPYTSEEDARAALSQFIREQLDFEQSLLRKSTL